MTLTLRVTACLALLFASCKKSDEVPAYVVIPSVTVDATNEEGGSTSKITDVWVSVNDRSLGIWELPARVPVLASGSNKINVAAAVKKNGAFDDRLRYPFYQSYNAQVDLASEMSVLLAPVVTYSEPLSFWLESFNEGSNQFNIPEESDTTLLLYNAASNPDIILDGSSCGGFVLTPERPRMSMYTDENFTPTVGPAFLELDYSTDMEITIGFRYVQDGNQRGEPWLILVPTASEGNLRWNKVYIDVSNFLNTAGISARNFYLAAALPSGRNSAHVYLDNFKLVKNAP